MVYEPLTKLQCCPTSDGGAAAVVVSQAFLDARPHLKSQAVLIAGQCLASDSPSLYDRSAIGLIGAGMTNYAAQVAMKEAQVTPEDIKVRSAILLCGYVHRNNHDLTSHRSASCMIASVQTKWLLSKLWALPDLGQPMRWFAVAISPMAAKWSSTHPEA